MNLMQISEQIKNVPDQQLAAMVNSPGMAPGYLVVAEMQRRASMRKAFNAEQAANPMNRKTVAQEMQNMTPAQIAPGVQGPGPDAQRFAGGGIMRLAGGGEPDEELEMDSTSPPSMPTAGGLTDLSSRYPVPTADQARQMFQQFRGPSPLGGISDALLEKENLYRYRKTKLGDILMSLGLGMAASRRPDMAGAIAEGGIGALNNWTSERNRNQQLADMYGNQRVGVLRQMQESQDVDAREMNQILNAMNSARNTQMMTEQATERQAAHDARLAEQARLQREHAAELARAVEEGKITKADADRAFDIWKVRQSAVDARKLEELRQKRPRGTGRGANAVTPEARLVTEIRKAQGAAIKNIREMNPTMPIQAVAKLAREELRASYSDSQLAAALPPLIEGGTEAAKPEEKGIGALIFDAVKGMITPSERKQPIQGGVKGVPTVAYPGAQSSVKATPPFMPQQQQQSPFGGISVLARGLGLPSKYDEPLAPPFN